MKKLRVVSMLMAIILAGSLIITCQKEGNEPSATDSEVTFAIDIAHSKSVSTLKRAMAYNLSDADKIIITIQNIDGSPTKYTMSEIKIQQMNGNYYTQKVVLKTGSYKLTEFLVVSIDGSTTCAAPITGSKEAQNVSSPLPIAFSVIKNITTPVSVEVLSTESKKPEDFGLNTFPIIEVKTFGFMIGMADKESNKVLSARLSVTNGSYTYVQSLDSILNNVVTVRDGLSNYTLTVEKSGYKTYVHTYPIDSLKMFKNDTGNLPLLIEFEKIKMPTNGLLAYYKFNGNANDLSGNNFNGTVYGATFTTDRFGNANNAISFNGLNQYCQVNHDLQQYSNLSMSFWFKKDGSSLTDGLGAILSSDYCYVGGYFVEVVNDGRFHAGGYYTLADFIDEVTIINDTWYHFSMITSDTVLKIYLNSILIEETSLVQNAPAALGYFNIGRSGCWNDGYRYFNGSVDDICIYNRSLSETEIQALHNASE